MVEEHIYEVTPVTTITNSRNIPNQDIVDVFKKERPRRDLHYDRPDGDDGKMIGSPITYGSRSKKNTTPSRQRYQGD